MAPPHPAVRRKVVITGMGIVSSIGLSCTEVLDSLQTGKSGIAYLPQRKELGFRSALSGVISGFVAPDNLERRYRKTLPDFGIWAWDAVSQALNHAGTDPEGLAGDERTGLIFGNDSSVVTGVEQCDILRQAQETKAIGSGHIFRLLNSTISLNLSTKLRIRGSSWTVSAACASGAMAIGQAAELIATGRQDRIICGSAQEISWQSMCSFDAIGAFSTREDAPDQASRPFDRDRDGLVPSGGAAALILEDEESAQKRGAAILAEVRGYGTASDGHHLSSPSGMGLEKAMRLALVDAGLKASAIDLVMAHATSTPAGDETEAEALVRLFAGSGDTVSPYIAATKSLTGHEFWMAGTSQVVYGILMSRAGFIAAHPTLKNPDSCASALHIPRTITNSRPGHILCNAAGFGGVNASLVIKVHP
jgi:3-oxoacyl-[acyl-carrier-protein] synthase I